MLLAREFIDYLSRQLVIRLHPQYIETSTPQAVSDLISRLITEELQVEDRLNEEVREILSQYSDYMRQEGVSYMEMFRKIKNMIIAERKVVRASGRDTGDNMKLSRTKVTELSHKIVAALKKSRDVRVKQDSNEVRLSLIRHFTDILRTEDKVDRAAREKIRSQKREIVEGSEEWDLLLRRYYAEELRKMGIDLAAQ